MPLDIATTGFGEILAITAVASAVLGAVVHLLERWEKRRAARRRMRPPQMYHERGGGSWN